MRAEQPSSPWGREQGVRKDAIPRLATRGQNGSWVEEFPEDWGNRQDSLTASAHKWEIPGKVGLQWLGANDPPSL